MKSIHALLLLACLNLGPAVSNSNAKDGVTKIDVAIPDKVEDLWVQIESQRKALGEAIAAKNKDDIHRGAGTLAALAKALPKKYPDFVAEKKKSIHHEAKSITRLCGDLQSALDEGKIDDANLILGQIDGALKFIKDFVAKK